MKKDKNVKLRQSEIVKKIENFVEKEFGTEAYIEIKPNMSVVSFGSLDLKGMNGYKIQINFETR